MIWYIHPDNNNNNNNPNHLVGYNNRLIGIHLVKVEEQESFYLII